MNHDLTPTSAGRGGDDGALSRRTSVSAVMVRAPQDHLDANEIHTVG
jgi:hypothetical protein